MKSETLYRDGKHRWLAFGQDAAKPENILSTNQFLVRTGTSAMLVDPGGAEVFPSMLAGLTDHLSLQDIQHVVFSHQDPDVISGLPLWRSILPEECHFYVPWMFLPTVAHYDKDAKLTPIPDEGMEVSLGEGVRVDIIPAHYLQSPGSYNVYDAKAKVLFSANVGGATLTRTYDSLYVTDFSNHVSLMEQFHRRWIGSPRARDAWVDRMSRLDIDVMAPQHGLIFKGENVKRFIDWFAGLDCGTGVDTIGRLSRHQSKHD